MVTQAHIFQRYCSRVNFKTATILNRDCAIIRLERMDAYLDQPIHIAAVVLDRSKATMIEWWYNVVKPTFERPGRSQLRCILTDTGG